MDNDLVIFKDLPDKTTPLNAYNLNHNFDVYNKKIETEAGKIDTTLQEIDDAKTQLQDDINGKNEELERNITNKTTELQSNITTATENSEQQIRDSNTQLTEQITTSNTQLSEQITKAREDLMAEIGKQIASISSLSILICEQDLPTENISVTTIYLIKPENLPSNVSLGENTVAYAQNLQSVPAVKPQVFNLNGEPLYREMFVKSNDIQTKASVQAIAEIPADEYYIACFWVRISPDGSTHKWVAVGTTKIDLTDYVKKEELQSYALKTEIPVVNNTLTSDSETEALSALQGKILADMIGNVDTLLVNLISGDGVGDNI